MTDRLLGVAYPLLLLAAFVILTVLLLAEARRTRRLQARALEFAARPPATLDGEQPLMEWCCAVAFMTHGRDHEAGRPCSR
jgi:hypothetical protein